MYMYVLVLDLFKIAFWPFCLGGGDNCNSSLGFFLFVNLVTLFSMHPFVLFGVLVGR